ncbi:hypothetical protein LR48_Vigan05g192900 [Vigna angularis]|uniref:Uncharacterized protein n=1 Tax=Phaseolus angularis TaxID=3914 RepID=A0A0L9UP49_PHAAN|nr:hypothetical protein LR48_Vigan05g192900 [Vigna angularis]
MGASGVNYAHNDTDVEIDVVGDGDEKKKNESSAANQLRIDQASSTSSNSSADEPKDGQVVNSPTKRQKLSVCNYKVKLVSHTEVHRIGVIRKITYVPERLTIYDTLKEKRLFRQCFDFLSSHPSHTRHLIGMPIQYRFNALQRYLAEST